MTHDLETRLEKLESRIPRKRSEHEIGRLIFIHFIVAAVAYYLGDPQDGEAIMSAYGRALGYPGSYEVVQAMKDKIAGRSSEFDQRYGLANQKLLTKLGKGPNDVSNATIQRIWEGLSERYKEYVDDYAHQVRTRTTWRAYPPSRQEVNRLRST